MKFGEKIRSKRELLGLSQSEVAKKIPMNQSSYSKIERDVQEPSMEQLKRICQILRLNPQYLLSLEKYDDSERDARFARDVRALYKKYYE